ncbi:MAG: glycosyltransferase [Kofleriaceae bacterium]
MIRLLAGRPGGAERLFCDIANLLAEAGYEVTVAYCDPRDAEVPYPLSPKVARVNLQARASRQAPWYRLLDGGAKRYERATGRARRAALAPVDWLSKNLYFLRRLYIVARDSRPDLILSFLPPANTPSLLGGWLAGVPVVPTNHSVPIHDFESDVRWDQNPIDRALRRWSLRTAERIHVLFPSYADWFPPALRDRVVAIPNGLSPEFEVPVPPRPRRRQVIAAGRLTDIKNYDLLLEAWALIADRHPSWRLAIYGQGPRDRHLKTLARSLKLGDRVAFPGRTAAIRDAFLESEIMVHPAEFEGFGLSVVEALACGTPVLGFAACEGVNQLVIDGQNGLLVDRAGGARALAEGLERMISDDDLRARLRANALGSIAPYRHEAFRDRWLTFVADRIGGDVEERR